MSSWTAIAPISTTRPPIFNAPVSRRSPTQTTIAPATPTRTATALPIEA